MHANKCTWCLIARETVNDDVPLAKFIQIKGRSLDHWSASHNCNKSEVDRSEYAEITIYMNTLPSENFKKDPLV